MGNEKSTRELYEKGTRTQRRNNHATPNDTRSTQPRKRERSSKDNKNPTIKGENDNEGESTAIQNRYRTQNGTRRHGEKTHSGNGITRRPRRQQQTKYPESTKHKNVEEERSKIPTDKRTTNT